ncbi:MAG: type I polyketide synthase [Verrucomicrobia bacterium]|nr:type I polyketide synthase [Verrucomicrobiota bacterium]
MPDALPQSEAIAIVGLAGRFPGARDVRELWKNLCAGTESITRFTDEELLAAGTSPEFLADPQYVRARATLNDADKFDAAFFGLTPRDAELTDPQHRIFLECAVHALEDAALDPARFNGSVGVFAGSSLNTYLLHNIGSHPEVLANFVTQFQADGYQLLLGNDKDYLATRVSYKLNLRGPSLNIQTACSTSLVAVVQAANALLSYQCDAALAGGVSITFPQERGHVFQDGSIASADGHCRAFDASATGTVFGHGCGVIVLKRLTDALADGDHIYAVIKGAAVNNDGAGKVSYMAPSVAGQSEVISLAHALAGVTADSIGYVEAHGTATPLGDPIEIAALTSAFRATTQALGSCLLGTVKSNFGHLEAAAGVTGLIKTALALHHGKIPPSLHFKTPNPRIDFANSPFKVVTQLTDWQLGVHPRRAGVSSFGVGGTNAHVVLEESPAVVRNPSEASAQLLVLSARTASALDTATTNLAAHLREHPETNLADTAFTLQLGRQEFQHRRIIVANRVDETADLLEQRAPRRVFTKGDRTGSPSIVFMFPGQGAQYARMGAELEKQEPVFREALGRCAEILYPQLACDLRDAMRSEEQIAQTEITQPALFAVEYALAQLWLSRGVRPAAMIGHSLGEYVAAVLSEVMSLEDALRLLVGRAKLVQTLPAGGMLAARLPESDAVELLGDGLSIAAANSPQLCVLSGTFGAIEAAEKKLEARGIAARRLRTSHAFHSAMMEPAIAPFLKLLETVPLHEPRIPYISNVTGKWITATEATDRNYWAGHIRQTVQFSAGVSELMKDSGHILIEVGPGNGLTQLVRQHGSNEAFPSLQDGDEIAANLTALGRLWLSGVQVDWTALHAGKPRRRTSLPGYPFERQRHWIEPKQANPASSRNGHDASMESEKTSSDATSEASVEEVILRQLSAMSDQLEVLRKREKGACNQR